MACGARHTIAPQFQLSVKPLKTCRAIMRPNQQKILLDTDDMLTCNVHPIIFSCIRIGKVCNCDLSLLAVSCELSFALTFVSNMHGGQCQHQMAVDFDMRGQYCINAGESVRFGTRQA